MTEAASASAPAPHVVTYERIVRGDFYADFRRDRRVYPDVFHCIIQRDGNPEILGWTQHRTLTAAQRAAEAELKALTEGGQKVATG